jgi:hypothetical protein
MPEHKILYQNRDGVKRTMIADTETPDKFTVHTSVEMDRVLESIKEAQEVEAGKSRPTNRHLARVPMTVYEQSIVEQWDENRWKQWLNDPDNAYFRVWPGRV